MIMSTDGETDLSRLLGTLSPQLTAGEYVFCTFPEACYGDYRHWGPLAAIVEAEGLTLIVEKSVADEHDLAYGSVFRRISLNVHSSLEAIGLTAAIAGKLAEHGIAANVIAGYFHDHILVPGEEAEAALDALREIGA